MGSATHCDPECDGSGDFDTINKDGRYGPLFPRRLPCPFHPACQQRPIPEAHTWRFSDPAFTQSFA